MNASSNHEIYNAGSGQTIADLFSNEVTGGAARNDVLQIIQQTSRSVEAGSGYDLPMFFISTDAGEVGRSTVVSKAPEFDLIRF